MGEGYYIPLFSPSDVTAFHRILMVSPLKRLLKFPGLLSNEMKITLGFFYALNKLKRPRGMRHLQFWQFFKFNLYEAI